MTGLTLVGELVVSDRALFISYEGEWHFPTYADVELVNEQLSETLAELDAQEEQRVLEGASASLAGVREKHAAEGILAAVGRCGEILQAHLPAAPKTLNQLPTALILED